MLGIARGQCPSTGCLSSILRTTTRLTRVARLGVGHGTLLQVKRQSTASVEVAPKPAVASFQLRSYQEECIQAVLADIADGHKRLGISIATGGGKTVIFSHLIDRLPSPTHGATRTLILAHRQELVSQAAAHCRRHYPDKSVEVEMGKSRASGLADITIASVLSLKALERLGNYDPSRFKLLVVDEAHHIVASSYMSILQHFKLLGDSNEARGPTALVGVSATFSRPDGLRLGSAIDRISFVKDFVEGIQEEWLSQCRFTTVNSGANLSAVRSTKGDFQVGSLSAAVNSPELNQNTVRTWMEIAKGRKSTLGFCVDIQHVQDLTNTFRENGFDARFVTNNTPPKERAQKVADFRVGKFPVLLNCGIFTEGTDIPNIDCILLARPTKSSTLLQQMVGRGVRTLAGKQDCHVIDMVASLAQDIVTTPTLFGLDPQEIVKDANMDDMEALKEDKDTQRAKPATPDTEFDGGDQELTYTHYDTVHDLIGDPSGERHIRRLSRLSWIQVDTGRWALSNAQGSYLTIFKNEADSFTLKATLRNTLAPESSAPFLRPYELTKSDSLVEAVRAGDTFAMSKWGGTFLFASAPWRKKPASEGQINFLNKKRPADKQFSMDSVAKGQAMDMITKMKFGAKGNFERMQSEKAKVAKAEVREQKKDTVRKGVQVGPLER